MNVSGPERGKDKGTPFCSVPNEASMAMISILLSDRRSSGGMLVVDFGHLGHYKLLVSALTGRLAPLRLKLGIIRIRPI
jgi:hypothetical protein